jgi:hypothetical protein
MASPFLARWGGGPREAMRSAPKLVVGKVQPSTSRRRQGYFQVIAKINARHAPAPESANPPSPGAEALSCNSGSAHLTRLRISPWDPSE